MPHRLLMPFTALAALAACAGAPDPGMTVEEFLTIHQRAAVNSAAHLQPDTRRMTRAADEAFAAVIAAQNEARRARRRPPSCISETPPMTSSDVAEALDQLNMPAELRRTETVRDALLTWAEETRPCLG